MFDGGRLRRLGGGGYAQPNTNEGIGYKAYHGLNDIQSVWREPPQEFPSVAGCPPRPAAGGGGARARRGQQLHNKKFAR